jgi:hypothetical protein
VKTSWTFEELAQKWAYPETDLFQMALEGKIWVSVWVSGLSILKSKGPSSTPWRPLVNKRTGASEVFTYTGWVEIDSNTLTVDLFQGGGLDVCGFALNFDEFGGCVVEPCLKEFPNLKKPKVLCLENYPNSISSFPVKKEHIRIRSEEVARMEATHPELVICDKDAPTEEGTYAKLLNPKHPWHSEPLANAIKAWLVLYSKREGNSHDNAYRPTEGNTAFIENWLLDNIDKKMGPTTRGHYCFIVNPSKQGGPRKTPE